MHVTYRPSTPTLPLTVPMPQPKTASHLRQRHKHRQHLPIIRRPQPCHRIPPAHRAEPSRATSLIPATGDIVHNSRIAIKRRIDEPNRALPAIGALLVDERDDGPERGRGRRGAVDERQGAVDCDDVVGAIGRHVRVPTYGLRVVVLRRAVAGIVVGVVGFHGRGLVRGLREHVAKAAAAVDDGLAGFLGGGHGGTRHDLRGADSGDVGAGGGEGGVEGAGAAGVVGAAGAFGSGAALAAVAGDARVAGGVEDGGALHAEFHVFVALADFVGGG